MLKRGICQDVTIKTDPHTVRAVKRKEELSVAIACLPLDFLSELQLAFGFGARQTAHAFIRIMRGIMPQNIEQFAVRADVRTATRFVRAKLKDRARDDAPRLPFVVPLHSENIIGYCRGHHVHVAHIGDMITEPKSVAFLERHNLERVEHILHSRDLGYARVRAKVQFDSRVHELPQFHSFSFVFYFFEWLNITRICANVNTFGIKTAVKRGAKVDKPMHKIQSSIQNLGGNMQEPIVPYPFAPEFNQQKIGACVLNKDIFLLRVTEALVADVPDNNEPIFLLCINNDLSELVCSSHGPKQDLNSRFKYNLKGECAYLHRSLAYPPLACIVTIMRRDEFLRRYNFVLPPETTHVITAVNVIHGHEHDLSSSLPVSA